MKDGNEYWRKHARRYDRSVQILNRRFAEMVSLVARDVAGRRRALELAAGTGLVTVALAPVVVELVATDLSSEMLAILSARLGEAGVKNVEVRAANAMALDFPDASFDAVVAANVLHLLPDPGRALAEWRRVLRPGGVLCAPTFGHGEHLVARSVSRILGWSGFPIVTRFRGNELHRLVESRGLTITRGDILPGVLPLICLTAESK